MDLSQTGLLARLACRPASRAGTAILLAIAMLLPATTVNAADVTMTAQPMLGGNVRPGAWAGFRVHLENNGPAVRGELRITGGAQGSSSYGTVIELATGARQDQLLYAQPMWFGEKLVLQLVSEGSVLARQDLKVNILDSSLPTVVVVAERPQGLLRDIRNALTNVQFGQTVSVLTVTPEDLPPRVEAWSAIDRLVWQDSDSSHLTTDQLQALSTWVGAGGRFAIVGGTTGTTGLSAFPAELLPFVPSHTADVQPADMSALFGSVPANATAVPGLAGTLLRGNVLGRTGDEVFAAQASYGQGVVSIVGVDPSTKWLAGTPAAESLWRRLMPATQQGVTPNPLSVGDDSLAVSALNNLPAVQLPNIYLLFALLLAYIAVVGPLNYLVLRRLDRREWAWVTMPVLVLVFAVAAYGVGLSLKGTDVIINQVGVVRGATGSDRGIGAFYVGVFAPSRHTFDVRMGNAALVSQPVYLQRQGQTSVPLDVVQGDPSHLRGYEVGFGVLRSFRAEAAVAISRVDTDFVFSGGHLKGSLTNKTDARLENVAVVYGGGVALFPNLEAGATVEVDLDITNRPLASVGLSLAQRIFGNGGPLGGAATRTESTRRAVIDQITSYTENIGGYGASQTGPIVLAWRPGPSLDVTVDTASQNVGETLAVLSAPVRMQGDQVFTSQLFARSQLNSTAGEAMDQGNGIFSLGRGSMTVDFRPIGLSGQLQPLHLRLGMSSGELANLGDVGQLINPLPAAQQPDQDDPLLALGVSIPSGTAQPSAGPTPVDGDTSGGGADGGGGVAVPPPAGVAPGDGKPGFFDGLPDIQLFDRTTNRWVEFPHFAGGQAYDVAEPHRYVDASGAFLVRFVNRAEDGNSTYFGLMQRLEGSIQ